MISRYVYPSPAIEQRVERVRMQVGDDLSYLTLLADLTTLSSRCQFALGEGDALVARYLDLPFAAVSFYGTGKGLREALSGVLDMDQVCYALVGEVQLDHLNDVAWVQDVTSEWQMVYQGDPDSLDPGEAVVLRRGDWSAIRALAAAGELHAFEQNALDKGPYSGVWRDGNLVSMAGTHLRLEGVAEIGNVFTHPDYRRQGLACMAVAATTQVLCAEGLLVLLHVIKSNQAAIALYRGLGFVCSQMMYLARFEL